MSTPHKRLHIDFETRSSVKLGRAGAHRYAEDSSTEILLIGYAFDNEPVESIRYLPFLTIKRIHEHIEAGGEVHAWNVQFERVLWNACMTKYPRIKPEQCHDTAALAGAMALPRGLAKSALALGITQEKDASGRRLMLRMSRQDGKVYPQSDWDELIEYCRQDVIVEREMFHHLRQLSTFERRLFVLDQKINDRGMELDQELIAQCLQLLEDAFTSESLVLQNITDGAVKKPTEVAKMLSWLDAQGLDLPNLKRPTVRDILKRKLDDPVREVLEIRRNLARTSTAKFKKMRDVVCKDGRARGMLLYHGASTGRWAGKLIQPQNLPRPERDDIGDLIQRIMYGLEIPGPKTHATVANVLRACFRAADGYRFIAGDYGQIEARVLAWLAGQSDLVLKFANGEKIYEDMAAKIYNVPLEKVSSTQRQVGKNSVLGAGYQMGAKRFREQVKTQAKGLVLSSNMAKRAIETYRDTYFRIPLLWEELNYLALEAVEKPGKICTAEFAPIRFLRRGRILWCILPSGRPLAYFDPEIRLRSLPEPWQDSRKPTIVYKGIGVNKQWKWLHTYGGKLTENVVQATARDLLAHAMLDFEAAGYRIVLTVHDEIVAEVPHEQGSQEEFAEIMNRKPAWARGLPLKVDTWEGDRFRK